MISSQSEREQTFKDSRGKNGKQKKRRGDATHDPDSEKALVGSLLIDPGLMLITRNELTREDFSLEPCGTVYAAMCVLHDAGKPFGDVVVLCSYLKQTKEFEKIGGAAFIASLANAVPSSFEVYLESVLRTSRHREICRLLQETIDSITGFETEEIPEPSDVIRLLDARLSGLGMRRANEETKTLRALGEKRLNEILLATSSEVAATHSGLIESGFPVIDFAYGGFRRTNNIVISARSGDGKSALAKQIASAMSRSGMKVRYVSLEMSEIEISDRVFAERCGINGKHLSTNNITPKEEITFCNEVESSESNFVIDSPVGRDSTWERIYSEARLQKATAGLDVFVLDYIQLVHKSNPREKDFDHLTMVSHGMKALARELDVVVLTLSQMNRSADYGAERREPRLSDLSMTSAIGNDADAVLFLHRDNPSDSEFKLIVGKWRGDKPRTFSLYFDGPRTCFREA